MEWTQNVPMADGFYFRVTTGHTVIKHIVADEYIDWGEKAIPVSSDKLKGWWWLGPLPFPPLESGISGFHWPECLRRPG